MRKLSKSEVDELRSFKGVKGGRELFFDKIEQIYSDDKDILIDIHKCRSMHDSLEFIESYPAFMKSQEMFYNYMDDLLKKIGYHN